VGAISIHECLIRPFLERQLGGLDIFLKYAQNYVQTFVGKSIGTETWKAHLYSYFEANGGPEKIAILDSVDWDVSQFCELLRSKAQCGVGMVLWRRIGVTSGNELRHHSGHTSL
jgi:hypothetical protein